MSASARRRTSLCPRSSLRLGGVMVLLLSGCGTVERALYERRVQVLPGAVVATNVVVIAPAATNAEGIVTGPKLAQVITPEIIVQYAPADIRDEPGAARDHSGWNQSERGVA